MLVMIASKVASAILNKRTAFITTLIITTVCQRKLWFINVFFCTCHWLGKMFGRGVWSERIGLSKCSCGFGIVSAR